MPSIIKGSMTSAALSALAKPEPKGVGELVKLMRDDHAVTLAEVVFRAVSKTAKVAVSVRHKHDEGTFGHQRERLLSEQMTNLWWSSQRDMSDDVAYGRVAFEKVWAASPAAGLRFVRKLEPLPFEHTEMRLTDDGNFNGVKLVSGKDGVDNVELDPLYSWWHALDSTALHPHGRSRFLGAPMKRWQDRVATLELRDKFARRFALSSGAVRVPDADDIETDGEQADPAAAAAQAHADIQSGGAVILPNTPHPTMEDKYAWDYDQYEVKANSSSPIIDLIDSMDAEQLLAFGIPPKVVIEGSEVGSFALVTWQVLILYSVVDDIVSQRVDGFQQYVVDKVAEANWSEPPAFTVNYTPLMERPDDLATELVKAWLTNPQLSQLVLSGAVDVQAVLESVGIPLSDSVSEKLESLVDRISIPDDPIAREGGVEMNAGPLSPFLSRSVG